MMDSNRIRIDRIEGLPPKKDGANSMWNKPAEVSRLIKLREAAVASFADRTPYDRNIGLTIIVHVGKENTKQTGDLDNFITGICDGLMAADPKATLSTDWNSVSNSLHPSQQIAIADDSQITSIHAEKVCDESGQWYSIELYGS